MQTSEILRRVREIQVRTGRQVADVLAGEYVSVFKGRGVEFDEVRPYVPGDDVRTIDWNVTARMGAPYIKRYVEERQLTLMLMADVSASQDYGSGARSKREATAELCALLAFSATRNDDKVGLALFHGEIEQYIPPRKGQRHALRVVREVLAHGTEGAESGRAGSQPSLAARRARPGRAGVPEPVAAALAGGASTGSTEPERGLVGWLRGLGGGRGLGAGLALGRRPRAPRQATDLRHALDFLMRVTKRRTICFVVSDFLDAGFERALVTANRKHDVIAVLVTDPAELEMPDVGLVALRDAESGATRVVDTGSKSFRETVKPGAAERAKGLERRLRSLGIDFIHVDASGDVVEPLVRFFRMRERRGRR
ncbi:MAG: DUF58 domain-containing protein [Deltaproteobacteria bacterium]|nr:DUF58 domain-containing protein [Deltaproteobacteria bacterium]